MPTYEFECQTCGVISEEVHRVADCPDVSVCPSCGKPSVKILSVSAVFGDTPPWIDHHLRDAIQGDGDKPIETRKDLADHCKKYDLVAIG